MNERIRELARQTGATDELGNYAENVFCFTKQELNSFTELIVRECANYITHKATIETLLGERLMEHFGVEE